MMQWYRRSSGRCDSKGVCIKQKHNYARAHTKNKLKITLPGAMTIVDTIADRYYGDKVKMAMAIADLLNEEARGLEADGVDVIQFDELAFNVFLDEVSTWGIEALERSITGLKCATVVHICYGYGIKVNIDWKNSLGEEWRQYEAIFPVIAKSSVKQVSLECFHSNVPPHLMSLLKGKDILVGVIDVASDQTETAEQVGTTIGEALKYVPKQHLFPCTNCGITPRSPANASNPPFAGCVVPPAAPCRGGLGPLPPGDALPGRRTPIGSTGGR